MNNENWRIKEFYHIIRWRYYFDNYCLKKSSPPASLESQRSQRNFSFNFLLRGQKAKNTRPSGKKFACFFRSVPYKLFLAIEANCPLCLPSSQRQTLNEYSLRTLRLCGETVFFQYSFAKSFYNFEIIDLTCSLDGESTSNGETPLRSASIRVSS